MGSRFPPKVNQPSDLTNVELHTSLEDVFMSFQARLESMKTSETLLCSDGDMLHCVILNIKSGSLFTGKEVLDAFQNREHECLAD